jgi:hypothetical protein
MPVLNARTPRLPRLTLLLGALVFLSLMPAARADPANLNEQKIKAGLVYNFLKYTDWRSIKEDRKLRVCLYGDGGLNEYLRPLQGRTAQQYTIEVVSLHAGGDVSACNLLFVSQGEEGDLDRLLETVKGKNILTVSDINRFTHRGGMAELSMQDDQRIHLYINRGAAAAAGIKIQGRLLGLAEEGGAP